MNVSEEINQLPQHLRDYIHVLETCIPAGLVQENICLKDQIKALTQKYDKANKRLTELLIEFAEKDAGEDGSDW